MLRENDVAKQELIRIKNGAGTQVLSRIGTVRGIKGNVQSRIRHKTSNAATNWSSKILVAAMSKNRYFKHAEKHALELFLRTSEENMERATKSMKRRSSSNNDFTLFPRRKWFRPGTWLFQQGDASDESDGIATAFILLEGHVKIEVNTINGKTKTIKMLAPGDHVGEFSLFKEGVARTAGAVVVGSSRCLVVEFTLKELEMDGMGKVLQAMRPEVAAAAAVEDTW